MEIFTLIYSIKDMFYFWLVIGILFLIFEMGSPGLFFFVSFSFGSFFAAAASLFGYSLVVQCLTFLTGTGIALYGLKHWLKVGESFETKHHHQTNVFAMQGKKGVVIKAIAPDRIGQVKVGGEIWSARPAHSVEIPEGTDVVVVRVSGSHLVVQDIKK